LQVQFIADLGADRQDTGRSEDPKGRLRFVGHQLGAPGRAEHELGPDLPDPLDRGEEGSHLVLDQRPDRAAHRRERVLDIHVTVGLDRDVVDEPEVDDVDAELRVEDLFEGFLATACSSIATSFSSMSTIPARAGISLGTQVSLPDPE
jgi:hypothetical protein